ncbi:MAG TPA: MFS transporter [Solirubrobacteraceae bacterium]|nr:MFS transporter [Solirubrobacteraceae bacterium]
MEGAERQHYGITLALLVVAGVSFAVMQTLVVPALPFFQREFDTTATSVTWIATGFLLSSSVLTPILGKLGDSYGKKRMLVISLGIFGVASLGAAAAWSLESLIFFRVIQGVGAAVFPLSFGIIRDEFPPEKIGLGIGTVSSVFGVGGGVGLVMSGVIIEHLSWHWLFLIGAVPVLAATVLLAMFVPESPVKFPTKPDYLGGLALSVALGSLLLAISEGTHWGWTSGGVVGLFALSVAMFYVWVVIEKRVPEPMVDLRTFARREMAATNLTTLLMGFSMFSTFILLPNFVQIPLGLPPDIASQIDYGFGATPVEVGLFFVPSSLAMMVAGPLAGALGTRFGNVLMLRIGIGFLVLALALLATVHDEPWTIYAWMVFMGVGLAMCFAALGTLVIDYSPQGETGVASGMNTIMRTIGAALGSQVAAAIITSNTIAGTEVPTESAFTTAFALSALGALVALLPTFLLSRRTASRPVPEAA